MVKDWCKAIAVVWVHFHLQRNAWWVELLFDGWNESVFADPCI